MINITSELFIFEPYKGTSHMTVALNVPPSYRQAHDVLFIYCNYCILNISFTIYSESIRGITVLFHNIEHVMIRGLFYLSMRFKIINLEKLRKFFQLGFFCINIDISYAIVMHNI